MEYYKVVVLMDGEKIKVTPDQAQKLAHAQQRGDKYVDLNDNMLAISSISRTEDTNEAIPTAALPGIIASDKPHQHHPITRPDNSVKAILIKKKVPQKYYDKVWAHLSSVYVLETDGSWVWAAMTHVPCAECGVTVPDALECEPDEYKRVGWNVALTQ